VKPLKTTVTVACVDLPKGIRNGPSEVREATGDSPWLPTYLLSNVVSYGWSGRGIAYLSGCSHNERRRERSAITLTAPCPLSVAARIT
jgi:hypothetical protein